MFQRAGAREAAPLPGPLPGGEREKIVLHFELVTPERLLRSEKVYQVVVPGTEGDFGVLEGHAPFMSTIRDGNLAIYRADKTEPELVPIRGGFAEVSKAGLTVLAEQAG